MESGRLLDLVYAYLVTFGWAVVGSLGMGIGLAIMLRIFTWLTPEVDEWKLVKEGNMPMGLVLAGVVLACGIVVAAAIRP